MAIVALTPLAAVADLSARGISTTEPAASVMLAVASATVRGAAGAPISQKNSTVTLVGFGDKQYLTLPGPPVTAVSLVKVDGQTVTDWRDADGHLWRRCGWSVDDGPSPVEATYTHGLPEVPADIVDLVCALAGAGIAAAAEGYETHNGIVAVRIDDYSVTYAQGAEAVASVMELPTRTRQWLRSRFGGSAALVESR